MDLTTVIVIVDHYGPSLSFIAALIGIVIAVYKSIHYVYKLRMKLKADGLAAEARLEVECRLLLKAGNTASARTDLGVYVNLELAKFQNQIASLHFYTLLGVIISITMAAAFLHARGTEHFWFSVIFFIIFIIIIGLTLILFHYETKETERFESYREKVFEIWKKPVEKRFK